MSAGTWIIKASNTVPGQASHAKMSESTIADRAGSEVPGMPQTNGITRLIQLEADALGANAIFSKVCAYESAVMDGGFGRIGAGECAGRACRRVS